MDTAVKTRVGILGGAFNPPTIGHLELAQAAVARKAVDEVWITPCLGHAFGKQLVDYDHRVKMCALMLPISSLNSPSKMSVFSYEETLNLTSGHTYDFITQLLADPLFAAYEFSYIIGQDNADTINSWYRYEDLLKMIPFLVFPRVGEGGLQEWYRNPPHQVFPHAHISDTSSTAVRDNLVNKNLKQACAMLHPSVAGYIEYYNLYLS
jgi:nicotinate-nucleotide adenylyltransferase